MRIMVGSTALALFDIARGEPKDIDYWVGPDYPAELEDDTAVMPERLVRLLSQYSVDSGLGLVATPDALYTIKCSHLAWDVHWQKTKLDILWLKAKGCSLITPLYQALRDYWPEEHGDKSFLSLKQDTKEFFNDHVDYVYDHDYLHELVAYPGRPMYERCLKDGEAVLVDHAKFMQMPFADRVRMFKEEITVIAFERWLVHNTGMCWTEAYRQSLKKTITNLTKGWATDFLILNLEEFNKPEWSLFEHLLNTLQPEEAMKMDEKLQARLQEFKEAVGEEDAVAEGYVPSEIEEKFGYKHLTQEGGGEGGTEYCFCVFELDGVPIRCSYSYYSRYGTDYDNFWSSAKVVEAKSKTVTVYE